MIGPIVAEAAVIAAADFDTLRACGLSGQKQGYAKSLAQLILDGELDWPEAQVSETTGRRFLQDHAIAPYLAARYGVGRPHP